MLSLTMDLLASQIYRLQKGYFGLSDKHFRNDYYIWTKWSLSEAKIRTDILKHNGFLEDISTVFYASFLWHLIWLVKKNVFSALITYLEDWTRNNQRGKDIRRIWCLHQKFLYEDYLFWWKRKYGYFIKKVDKFTLCHTVCQHEIGRKGVLLPTHHAATLHLATRKHSKTFQRLLSFGKK